MPPFAPVAAMREVASELVVQVTEVPGLLTRGRAKHDVPPAQDSVKNFAVNALCKFGTDASDPASCARRVSAESGELGVQLLRIQSILEMEVVG